MTFPCKDKVRESQPSAACPWAPVLLLVLLVALISGCTVATHEPKTPIEVPAQFSGSGSASLPDQWWLSFNDRLLSGLVDQAPADNFDLKTALDRLRQAEALARSAGADLFPTIDAEVENSRNRFREAGETDEGHSYSLGLAASYELDLWGRIKSSRDAARFEAQASAQDLKAAALTLSAQVAGTWYQLVEQDGQLEMLDRQMNTNVQVLELVTLQFRTGQVGIADMLQQRQLVESNQGEKTQVEAQVKVLEHQLAILLGVSPGQLTIARMSAVPITLSRRPTGTWRPPLPTVFPD